MTAIDLKLVQDDAILWQGSPSWRSIARDVYHVRFISAYLAFLALLDAFQAWSKDIPFGKALHDSVPLAVIIVAILVNFCGLAWLTARTTCYTITTRRVILTYGIAISATLSIPWSQIVRIEFAPRRDETGDIALRLSVGEHMPYLKLWPHARPWHLRHPEPMLRGLSQAAAVADIATRAAIDARRMTAAVLIDMPHAGAALDVLGSAQQSVPA